MLEDHRHHARRPGRSRRSRQLAPRGRTVRFGLSDEEFAELEAAAARAGQARGAFAAEAALAAARGETILAAGDQLALHPPERLPAVTWLVDPSTARRASSTGIHAATPGDGGQEPV